VRLALAALVLVAAPGCKERAPAIDPAYVAANLVSAPPALDRAIDADLGGAVIYLGNTVSSTAVSPGGRAEVVHYWKVVKPPGDAWAVFSHLVSGAGDWLNVDQSDMRQGHPPAAWRAGQIIRDEHRFTVPPEWTGEDATLVVGLYRRDARGKDGRMPVTGGEVDAEGRLVVARLAVARSARPGGEYAIRRARGPITLDGVADEADWKAAPHSPEFTDAEGGAPVGGRTAARLLWDDQHLYAFVEVEDADVFSSYRGRDDPLWKEDVIELFIDADGDRKGYVELQVNPNGAIFDAFFPGTRAQPHHVEWNGGMRAAVVVHGTADRRDDRDRGWDVELAIPHADVKGMAADMAVRIPPVVGDRWRLNVVRVDKPRDAGIRAATWSPITIGDFHALGRMLTVVFADADGKTAAQ
jgi:hypothetical protein